MNKCILAVIMLSLQTFIFGSLLEGDPDNWVYAYLYNISISTVSERASQLGHAALVFVLSDLMQTPAVATAWFKEFGYIFAPLFDLVSIIYDWATNGDGDIEAYEEIKTGTYTGLKRYQKNLLKASSQLPDINTLGIDNLYKDFSMDAINSRGDWYAQIAPTPWISYVPRFNGNKKGQKGIYGLLLNDESNTKESTGMWQTFKNVLKGPDAAGEEGRTSKKKASKSVKSSVDHRRKH